MSGGPPSSVGLPSPRISGEERENLVAIGGLGAGLIAWGLFLPPFLALPVGVTAVALVAIKLGWSEGGKRFSGQSAPRRSAQVIALALVFLASGGARYAYGYQDTLTAELYIPAEEIRFGSNESYAGFVVLHNEGILPVRLQPAVSIVFRYSNGTAVAPNLTGCPVPTPPSPTDTSAIEIGGGESYAVPFLLSSKGKTSDDGCKRWDLSGGTQFELSAVVSNYARTATLPTWTASVETPRLPVEVTAA